MEIEDKKTHTLRKLEGLRDLGFIPKVLFEVQQLIKSDPGNFIKLGNTISKDQGLATKVVSIANSPLYGLQRKVSSIEFALMVMGTEEINQIVTAVSLLDAIKFRANDNFNFMDYWRHSMLVGTASKDIARRLGFTEVSGEAFLAGMLHDVGIQLIVKFFPDEFDEIMTYVKAKRIFIESETEVLGITHQEMGNFLARKWSLPENLADVIHYHHHPSEAQLSPVLASIVHLADSMTQEYKIGNVHWDNEISFDTGILELLGFSSNDKFVAFLADYREIFSDAADSIKL